jgi:CelD/BcsL family acetyltransferase involved in cellulose biosynthesis
MATRSEAPPSAASGRVLDPGDVRWARFVADHPDALPFHDPAWVETLRACYRFRPRVVTVTGPDGDIRGGMPIMELRDPLRGRRWTALPFTDRCPPLLADAEAEAPLAVGHSRSCRVTCS